MTDDLSIPPFLDLRNPDVAARREADRKQPLATPRQVVVEPKHSEPDVKAFEEAEAERKRIETQHRIARMKQRKEVKSQITAGSRWDSLRNRFITPEEDFRQMAKQARTWDGEPMTVEELRAAFEEVARLPDLPLKTIKRPDGKTTTVDPNENTCRTFARRILSHLPDNFTKQDDDNTARTHHPHHSSEWHVKRRIAESATGSGARYSGRLHKAGRRRPASSRLLRSVRH